MTGGFLTLALSGSALGAAVGSVAVIMAVVAALSEVFADDAVAAMAMFAQVRLVGCCGGIQCNSRLQVAFMVVVWVGLAFGRVSRGGGGLSMCGLVDGVGGVVGEVGGVYLLCCVGV